MLLFGRKLRKTWRVSFFQKNTSFPKSTKFSTFFFFQASENIFFRIQHQKLSLDKLLNRLQSRKSFDGGASNRAEPNTHRSILEFYLVFLRKWWSRIFYFIRFIIPPVTKLRIAFFSKLLGYCENLFFLNSGPNI